MDNSIVKRLPRNLQGRDFIVGDIHGAFDLVWEGMKAVKFDRQRDRLISVGDLVDRGSGSARCLEFLHQPYVQAVRGNHDDDFTSQSIEDLRVLARVRGLGLGWTQEVDDQKLQAIQQVLATLPVALEIETARGLVGVVHAEVPTGMSWPAFVSALRSGDPQVRAIALTGRQRLKHMDATPVAGVGRVYVGHSVQWAGVLKLGNVVAVDTGAVFREVRVSDGRGALTIVNIVCRTDDLVRQGEGQAVHAITSDQASAFSALRPAQN